MKNRKKPAAPNTYGKPVPKRSDSLFSNKSSTSLEKSFKFWQEHNLTFQKTNHCGDSESYFKKTLRNYNHFDPKPIEQFLRFSRSSHSSFKQSSSLATPRSARQRTKFTLLKSREVSQQLQLRSDEEDADVFYSPGSDSLKNSALSPKATVNENKVDVYLPEKIMAEEGEEATGEPLPPEETDDEMKEVEEMIKQASTELEQVAEENQQLIGNIGEEEGGEEAPPLKAAGEGGGSSFKFDPAIDAAVLKELEEAERQAQETARIITDLKARVTELLKKEKCTEAEAKELEEKNMELKEQMLLFEQKTKRIQFLIAQSNLFDNMLVPTTPLQTKHKEDALPKVIVCGATGCDNMPKLILCDARARTKSKSRCCPVAGDSPEATCPKPNVVPKIAKRLSDSYCMQEKLAAENADLEGMRYKLQSDLLNKDHTIEALQRKLCSIQCEMRMICNENAVLNDKIQEIVGEKMECPQCPMPPPCPPRRAVCGKRKGDCPSNFEDRLNEYSETTRVLEKQLMDMETDVKAMHTELQSVQAEREHLEQHRNIVICPPLCLPPCAPSPCPPCPMAPCSPRPNPCDQPLRELREQYNRLQDDFKGKVVEVAGLRADNEKLKRIAIDAEEAKKLFEEKLKECERICKQLRDESQGAVTKEQLIELEQQLSVAKQRFREAQDELEELRLFIQDQQAQMDDYRNKYLEAEQRAEEQRRHIDMLEMDATRINEQVNLEIQRVKGQFQEKLHELMPLPDILKTTQLKMQEAQQMHLLAERNAEALEKELQLYKEKVAAITEAMELSQRDAMMGEDERTMMLQKIEDLENELKQLKENFDLMQEELGKAEALIDEKELEVQARQHEITQLQAQLESVREESARQVARNKERCETVRRSMQNQISDLERQLVQSRAAAKAAQKDRDEIRQKMQMQINNLHENFEDAQMRIRNLQGHVNFLKVSYPAPIGGETDSCLSEDLCNCP